MKTLAVPADRMIRLPKGVFKPADRVVILHGSGVLIIKKLESPPLSSIAARVKDRPIPLREIAREVHAYRRSQRPR